MGNYLIPAINNVNLRNDPLLIDKSLKIFSDNGVINLYRILFSYDQEINPLISYYHLDKVCRDSIIESLKRKYKTIDETATILLKALETYRNETYASKIKEKWRVKDNLIKGNITLEYARVISLILAKNIKDSIKIFNSLILKSKFFIVGKRKVKVPLLVIDLNNDLAYLAGIICGDGHIEKDLCEMKIVDGHHDSSFKKYSYEFLNSIDKIIKRNFNLHNFIEEEDNYIVFRYSSSAMCRIMNYIYQIPTGDKSRRIKVPKILKNTNKEGLFWRGIFDTDGSIRIKNKSISLFTTSKELYEDFLDFCKRKTIILFNKKEKNGYRFIVAEESIPNFSKTIGIFHPRKQRNLLEYLRKGASYNIPKNKKLDEKLKLDKVIEYLRPYKYGVYIKLTKRREFVSKEKIRKKIKFIEKILNRKVVMVKRPRKNDHYYICSRKLVEELNKNYRFSIKLKILL